MIEILTMGEIIVEIMRKKADSPLYCADEFLGPFPSGAPAIFADTAARLGHKTAIVGGVGNDDFGKCLLDRFEKDGVSSRYINVSDNDFTGCAFVTYFGSGERKFIFHINNTAAINVEMPDISAEKDIKYFHIMGCSITANEHFANMILTLARQIKYMGGSISFDPNIRPELIKNENIFNKIYEIIDIADVFLPGKEELLQLSKKDSVKEAVDWCFEHPNIKIVVVKNGSHGCTVYTRTRVLSTGVYNITPVDATGAGDSFDAAFICSLIEGKDLENSVKYASATAALNTAAFGPMEGNISVQTVSDFIKTNDIEVKKICRM